MSEAAPASAGNRVWLFGLLAIVLLGLCLRLYSIHAPILDHPGWRQGDGAAIARNFALLQNNIFYPQTDYNGPPPHYVELELQLAPFAAAQLYRVFGIHETFIRLIVVAFSVATIVLLFFFAGELRSPRAGLIAALLYAIAPGAVYYGRTLTPDSLMIFFSTGTLFFWWRWCKTRRLPDFFWATGFGALAWLAKPPALLVLVPLLAMSLARLRWRAFADWSLYAFAALTLTPFFLYFAHVHAIAEWHWFTGITQKHVLPTLWAELSSLGAFISGLQGTFALLRMLAETVLGPLLLTLALIGALLQPRDDGARARAWLFGSWGAVLCLYAFVVVNVERVDYYLLPWLPLAALVAALGVDAVWERLEPQRLRAVACAALAVATFVAVYVNMLEIHPYYTWSRPVYRAAAELKATLLPDTLIVMGHKDPSVLYLIGRKGWEEDPLDWTVFDMQSAIAKGARYFVAIEVNRFHANKQLYRYMQRFARVRVQSNWEVFDLATASPL
ncbi:MAG TPA: glycosyltransferase family 39 protein [Candidatus Tumulicola sp.]|nr:glycosyltransferase family 39 protein [Candidatus Tumulicola sp.]